MAGQEPIQLTSLPVEIIWCILLFSRSPNLAQVCRALRYACNNAPNVIKAEYLLCCWFDSYGLRFTQGSGSGSTAVSLQYAFLPTVHPPSGNATSLRRAATSDILSYVTRYGICTSEVVAKVERIMIQSPIFGNISQLYGMFSLTREGAYAIVPSHISCHALPERLFHKADLYDPISYYSLVPSNVKPIYQVIVKLVCELVPTSMSNTKILLPPFSHLELILRMILLHHASPNSSHGYPLAMCVHLNSVPMICLLLAAGADPSLKKNIALHVAVKQHHLPIVQLLVEQSDKLEYQWRSRLRLIAENLRILTEARRTRRPQRPSARAVPPLDATPPKRQKLSDRCSVDLALLKTAVRSKAWDIVTYLLHTKGLIPDVDTLKIMDKYGMH